MSRERLEAIADGWRGSESDINVAKHDCVALGVKCPGQSVVMKASRFVGLVDKLIDKELESRRKVAAQ